MLYSTVTQPMILGTHSPSELAGWAAGSLACSCSRSGGGEGVGELRHMQATQRSASLVRMSLRLCCCPRQLLDMGVLGAKCQLVLGTHYSR